MSYLITGATGNIGARIVERLLARDIRPTIFVRDADKAHERYADRVKVAVGDLGEAQSLVPALKGIKVLFLANAGPDLAAKDQAAARAAKEAGVQLLVKLSTYDAIDRIGTGVWHAAGEASIRASGVGCAFVQPSGFMDNALNWAKSIKSEGVVRTATGEGRIPFIHSDDIAEVAVACMTVPRNGRVSFPITGPEALSYPQMAALIGEATGKSIRCIPLSDEQVRREQLARGEPEPVIQAHLSIFHAIRENRLAAVTDGVESVLGRPPISFEHWVQEHADSFN
jgi:uncharacterized protein YbjT (DUF2867 family)